MEENSNWRNAAHPSLMTSTVPLSLCSVAIFLSVSEGIRFI